MCNPFFLIADLQSISTLLSHIHIGLASLQFFVWDFPIFQALQVWALVIASGLDDSLKRNLLAALVALIVLLSTNAFEATCESA